MNTILNKPEDQSYNLDGDTGLVEEPEFVDVLTKLRDLFPNVHLSVVLNILPMLIVMAAFTYNIEAQNAGRCYLEISKAAAVNVRNFPDTSAEIEFNTADVSIHNMDLQIVATMEADGYNWFAFYSYANKKVLYIANVSGVDTNGSTSCDPKEEQVLIGDHMDQESGAIFVRAYPHEPGESILLTDELAEMISLTGGYGNYEDVLNRQRSEQDLNGFLAQSNENFVQTLSNLLDTVYPQEPEDAIDLEELLYESDDSMDLIIEEIRKDYSDRALKGDLPTLYFTNTEVIPEQIGEDTTSLYITGFEILENRYVLTRMPVVKNNTTGKVTYGSPVNFPLNGESYEDLARSESFPGYLTFENDELTKGMVDMFWRIKPDDEDLKFMQQSDGSIILRDIKDDSELVLDWKHFRVSNGDMISLPVLRDSTEP